jgi:hypothetical protein
MGLFVYACTSDHIINKREERQVKVIIENLTILPFYLLADIHKKKVRWPTRTFKFSKVFQMREIRPQLHHLTHTEPNVGKFADLNNLLYLRTFSFFVICGLTTSASPQNLHFLITNIAFKALIHNTAFMKTTVGLF